MHRRPYADYGSHHSIHPLVAGLLALAIFASGSATLNALLLLYALGSRFGGLWFPLAVATYILAVLLTARGFGWAARMGSRRRTSAAGWAAGMCMAALYFLAVGFELHFATDWLFPPLGRDPQLSLGRVVGVSFSVLLFLVIAEATTFNMTDEYRPMGDEYRGRRPPGRRGTDVSDDWLDRLEDVAEVAGPDTL